MQASLPLIEALRIVSMKEASRLAGVSQRTLKNRYRDKIIKRGLVTGMRVGDALQINVNEIEPTATTE